MPSFRSIRARLIALCLFLVTCLVATNLVLIHQVRLQNDLIGQQARHIDVIVRVGTAVQTFGDLKYWLTDLAVSQLVLSQWKADEARQRLLADLAGLDQDLPDELAGLAGQLRELTQDTAAAAEAYRRDDRLTGHAMMAQGRRHIIAVDTKLSSLVDRVRTTAQLAADHAIRQTEQGVGLAVTAVVALAVLAAGLTLLAVRSIVTPLRQMAAVIREMGRGRMDVPIPAAVGGEVGDMANVLALFRDSVVRRSHAERVGARLREAIDSISEGVGLFDSDDRLVLCNRRFREGLCPAGAGESVAELLEPGTPFEALVRGAVNQGLTPDAPDRPEAWVEERLSRHRAPGAPWVFQWGDGRWIRVSEYRTAEQGTITLTADITALKRHEQESARKTALLEATMENMGQGISMIDAELTVVSFNRMFLELFDLPADRFVPGFKLEAALRHCAERGEFGSGDVERFVAERLALARSGEPVTREHQRPDGTVVEIRSNPQPGDGGVVTTYTDITERKRAEEAVQRQARILDQLYDAVVVIGLDGKISGWNPAAERIYGYSKAEMLGRSTTRLYRSLDHARQMASEVVAQIERDGRWVGEWDNWHKSGRRVRIEAVVFRLYDDQGEILSTVAVGRDITDRKRAEIELREAKEQAEVANRAKSQFLANMSHELRTPLNAILGYSELISDRIYGEVPERIAEIMARIDHNGRHLLRLINDVLDLSKIEAGQLSLSLGDYSMASVVESVERSLVALAEEKSLTLRSEVPADLPLGRGDEQRITQVLLNLVGNGIKFTESGEVAVRVGLSGEEFRVSVTDTGIGLSEDEREQVFREFHQADSSDTRKQGGTGLGLTIARRMVYLHGGKLWADSASGQGTTFHLVLPVRVEDQRGAP